MPACATCGAEHELLDPTFRRPEAWVRLDPAQREEHGKSTDDVCRIALPGEDERFFVRGTLPVEVEGFPDGVWWGLWAEVSESAYARILALWSDDDQASEPPFDGALANRLPSYPDTLGIPLRVQLTGPTSRPEFGFEPDGEHPFVRECLAGVDLHRAAEWNRLIEEAP